MNFKRIMGFIITIVTVSMLSCTTVSAFVEGNYDLNDPEYKEYVDSFHGTVENEEEVLKIFNTENNYLHNYHIYMINKDSSFVTHDEKGQQYGAYSTYCFEYGNDEKWEAENGKKRYFDTGFVDWDHLCDRHNDAKPYSKKELNNFLGQKGYPAEITDVTTENNISGAIQYDVKYKDGTTFKEVTEVCKALRDEYNIKPFVLYLASNVYFTEEKDTVTVLNGDVNSDGKKNVRDCAFIANALSKGKAESLPDTADYNKDGKKNVRDAAAISKDLASK